MLIPSLHPSFTLSSKAAALDPNRWLGAFLGHGGDGTQWKGTFLERPVCLYTAAFWTVVWELKCFSMLCCGCGWSLLLSDLALISACHVVWTGCCQVLILLLYSAKRGPWTETCVNLASSHGSCDLSAGSTLKPWRLSLLNKEWSEFKSLPCGKDAYQDSTGPDNSQESASTFSPDMSSWTLSVHLL